MTRLSPRKSPFQRAKAFGNPHNSTLVRSVASQRPHQMCDRPTSTCKKSSGNQQHVKVLLANNTEYKHFFFFLSDINHSNTCKHCANYFTEHFTFVLTKCHTNTGVTVTDVCRRQKPDKWRHCQQAGRTICQISISAGLEYSNSKQMV